MEELILDFANGCRGHIDVLVHKIGVITQLPLEQTDGLVAPPTSVAYLLSEKEVSSRYSERRAVAGVPNGRTDFCGKLRRTPLIRVQDEDPARPGPRDRMVSGGADRREAGTYHRRSGSTGPIDGVVKRVVLDDDDLASPFDARNALFYVRGFIVSRDHRRYVGGAAAGRTHP